MTAAGQGRLGKALQRARDGGALSIYLPAGHPDAATCRSFFDAAVRGGADWIEIGIPFSDPAADGPAIQAATARAVRQGYRVRDALALARGLRDAYPDLPLVAMTYANIAHRRGWDAFAHDLQGAGIDGLILPDVPLEEAGPVRQALRRAGVAWIPLVTPATDDRRMAAIAATCTGFLYVVGNVGTTGQDDPGTLVESTVARARAVTQAPLAVGFGISSHTDVARVRASGADACIVGSHIVRMVERGASPAEVEEEVNALRRGLEEAAKASRLSGG